MRSSKTSGSMVRDPQSGFWQALKLSAAVLGVGLVVMSAGAARAGDDDDEDDGMTFEEKIIDNLMSGIETLRRASGKSLPPVILLSTKTGTPESLGLSSVIDAVVAKPITPERLQPVIDRLISR